MDIAAKVSSRGQVTVPKAVRDALGLEEGDRIVFRVDGNHATLAKTADFLSLAGSIPVGAAERNVAWDDVLHRTRAARSASRRPSAVISTAMHKALKHLTRHDKNAASEVA